MKNSNDTISNRTSDLPICNTAPLPKAKLKVKLECDIWNLLRQPSIDTYVFKHKIFLCFEDFTLGVAQPVFWGYMSCIFRLLGGR